MPSLKKKERCLKPTTDIQNCRLSDLLTDFFLFACLTAFKENEWLSNAEVFFLMCLPVLSSFPSGVVSQGDNRDESSSSGGLAASSLGYIKK